MKYVIDGVNSYLHEAMKCIICEYETDDTVYQLYVDFQQTNDPAERAELLRNTLDYIKGFKDYGEETSMSDHEEMPGSRLPGYHGRCVEEAGIKLLGKLVKLSSEIAQIRDVADRHMDTVHNKGIAADLIDYLQESVNSVRAAMAGMCVMCNREIFFMTTVGHRILCRECAKKPDMRSSVFVTDMEFIRLPYGCKIEHLQRTKLEDIEATLKETEDDNA